MLPKLGRPFRMREGNCKQRGNNESSHLKAVGLRILVNGSAGEPNVVVKQSMRLTPSFGSTHNSSNKSCFLNSCFLCSKKLSPQEDIYMYRGDQGYCSVECRNSQIEIDERIELEASTKKMLASFRRCHDSKPSETRLLLEDLRRRHDRPTQPRFRTVVS